ncbi:MAG: hypothetical protein AB3N17_18895 [Tateyamaria sp.]
MALKMSKSVVLIAALATAVAVASAGFAGAQQTATGDQRVAAPSTAQGLDAAALLRFQSAVRTASPSTHLAPTVRQAQPSAHLGPNYRQTTHETQGVVVRRP